MLFSFLLAPAARRLEALHLGRMASTLIVVALFVGVIGTIGWAAGRQVISLAGKLPEYKDNISHKLRTLHSPPAGELGKAYCNHIAAALGHYRAGRHRAGFPPRRFGL